MLYTETVESNTLELLRIDLIDRPFNWKKIEKRIREMIRYENRVFETMPC